MSRVVVVFTGGTISMRYDAEAGGAVPSLDGAEILARTPGLDALADVEPIDWGLVPASHLSFDQILELARTVGRALQRSDVDGAVVVQGTDTIEETAFALDLVLGGPKPVVVVGSMRNAGEEGYEGPANLRDAVRCAADPMLRDQGTVVVMAGTILPADDATKTHTDAYETFRALNFGALGRVDSIGVAVTRRRARRRLLPSIPDAAAEPVFLVTAVVASDGALVRVSPREARGFVVAATGAGNTSPDLLDACSARIEAGVPVVLTTRCPSGRVKPAYGFPGGGATWERAGAILAGHLSGPKARVALALALGAGLERDELRRLFAD